MLDTSALGNFRRYVEDKIIPEYQYRQLSEMTLHALRIAILREAEHQYRREELSNDEYGWIKANLEVFVTAKQDVYLVFTDDSEERSRIMQKVMKRGGFNRDLSVFKEKPKC